MKRFILAASLFSVALAGCGKDQDQQDYQNNQLHKAQAQLQAVAGTYTGQLYSSQDNSLMGGLQIILTPSTSTAASQGGDNPTALPTMDVTVTLLNQTSMVITTQSGGYDNSTGLITADFTVNQSLSTPTPGASSNSSSGSSGSTNSTTTNSQQVIHLSARVGGGSMSNGLLFASAYAASYGGHFSASMSSPNLNVQAAGASPKHAPALNLGAFSGSTDFHPDPQTTVTRPVYVTFQKQQNTTADQDFLYVLSPLKNGTMTFDYGAAVHLQATNAQWNQQTGSLQGTLSIQASTTEPGTTNSQLVTFNINTTCTTNGEGGFKCTHTDNAGNSNVTSNISPVDSSTIQSSEPPGSDTLRAPVVYAFTGQGTNFIQGAKQNLLMTVTYPARDRLTEVLYLFTPQNFTELEFQVGILFDYGSYAEVPVTLSAVKYDSKGGSLDGQQSISNATFSTILTLSCQNFNFAVTAYDFTCQYSGGAMSGPATLRFVSSQPPKVLSGGQPNPPTKKSAVHKKTKSHSAVASNK